MSESEAWRVAMSSEDSSSGRLPVPMRVDIMRDAKKACSVRAEEVCEKRSGREGLPVANSYPLGLCARTATLNEGLQTSAGLT